MNAVLVNRGGKEFGPYPIALVRQYIINGTLFPHDLARDSSDPSSTPVALDHLLRQHGIAVQMGGGANPIQQAYKDLKSFDLRLILPWNEIRGFRWIQDRRLLALAGVGLSPIFILSIAPGLSSGYWLIALYFSALWALFFFYMFRTGQTDAKACVLLFFFTGVVSIPILLALQNVPPWTGLYSLAASQDLLGRFCGMFFGVGIHEELCKAALLFWIVRRPGRILMPQTVVFYGMMSGLGFGIYEGVAYQTTVNRAQEIDTAYFLNVARLTSLPFLHAIWTGIAGYFVSFSALYPRRRFGLWVVAIVVPALLHGLYNTFGWSFMGLGAALLSVVLLMTYLANCIRMQQSLATP